MKLLDLKHFEQFQGNKAVKVLRHTSEHWEQWKRNKSEFCEYQDEQSKNIFDETDFIISFIGRPHKCAVFIGVWEVLSGSAQETGGFLYKTREVTGFDDLKERLIIQWGEGTIKWDQRLYGQGNKEIVEILPQDYEKNFPGFYNITLSYDQLKKITENPIAHREWQRMLSSVNGVYLILDVISGKQYVGSAYGANGIWGRWKEYAKTITCGNKLLDKVIEENPEQYKKFQFSILRVLEPNATKEEVISQETITKIKLGSRAFGLNGN